MLLDVPNSPTPIPVDTACVFAKADDPAFAQFLSNSKHTRIWDAGAPVEIATPGSFVPLPATGPTDAAPWYVGAPTMSTLAAVHDDVELITEHRVQRVVLDNNGAGRWRVDQLDARWDALVVALPVARAVRLWPRLEGALDAELFGADFEKTRFSIVLAFDRPLDVGFRVAWPKNSPLTLLYDDSSRSAATAAAPAASVWVGQSDTAWAAARLKQPAAATAAELLAEFSRLLGAATPPIRSRSARRSYRGPTATRRATRARTAAWSTRASVSCSRATGATTVASRARGGAVTPRPTRCLVFGEAEMGRCYYRRRSQTSRTAVRAERHANGGPSSSCEASPLQHAARSTQHEAHTTCRTYGEVRFGPWLAGCFFFVVG